MNERLHLGVQLVLPLHTLARRRSLLPAAANGATAQVANVRDTRPDINHTNGQAINTVPSNGHTPSGDSASEQHKGFNDMTEMFVASADELHDHKNGSSQLAKRLSIKVPPPRAKTPRKPTLASNGEAVMTHGGHAEADMRDLKNELGLVKAELRDASIDFKASQRTLRAREGEITLLKAALAGRDINLRNSKAELVNAQRALGKKDTELQEAYQQMVSNAEERGDVRRQLLDAQAELAEARTELRAWAQTANDGSRSEAKDGLETGSQLYGNNLAVTEDHTKDGSLAEESHGRRESDVSQLMRNLSNISGRMAEDAKADDVAFQISGGA